MSRISFGPFSIDATPDWTLSTLILSGPADDAGGPSGLLTTKAVRSFQQTLVVTMEQVAASDTPEKYVERQIKGLKEAGVSRTEAKKPERVKVGGGEGLILEQIVVGPTGERVRQMQLVTMKNGVAFVLIASHLDGASFDKARESFEKILLSFQ